MKRQNRLTSETESQEQQTTGQHAEGQSATEFANVEEMLRHDRLHTPVPPGIEQRLQQSTATAAPRSSSWWKRLFGGTER